MLNWIRNKFVTRRFLNHSQKKFLQRIKYEIRYGHLLDCILHSSISGVTEQVICDHEVIVSLTTYGKRIREVAFTIESIMQGSVLPNRIILWLEDGLQNCELPKLLQNQQKRGLEIRFCKDIKSYKKIIPTLLRYPDACIITVDDDVLYDYDMVESLVTSYKNNSMCIHTCRARDFVFDSHHKLMSYVKWPLSHNGNKASYHLMQTGVGGVLYPPKSLHPDVFKEDIFMELSPYGDDIWLYVMAVRNGYPILKVDTKTSLGCDYLENEEVQDTALYNQNGDKSICRNDIQIKALFEKYNMHQYL